MLFLSVRKDLILKYQLTFQDKTLQIYKNCNKNIGYLIWKNNMITLKLFSGEGMPIPCLQKSCSVYFQHAKSRHKTLLTFMWVRWTVSVWFKKKKKVGFKIFFCTALYLSLWHCLKYQFSSMQKMCILSSSWCRLNFCLKLTLHSSGVNNGFFITGDNDWWQVICTVL